MASKGPLVLVVDDEQPMRRYLRAALQAAGYQIVEAATARECLAQTAGRNPELILLDLTLPDGDGLELTVELRTITRAPIVVISARGQERDKVAALDRGADDYLTKPFGTSELLARMRAALRHAGKGASPEEGEFAAGPLRVDLERRQVFRSGEEVHLTPTEYRLLQVLVRNAGRVVTHRQLLQEVWGANRIGQTQYLRVYLAQLRHKHEADPARPRLLVTEPGVGYRLRDD
ncbi:MAG: response regulator [Gemmatimonadales bacterium]